MRGEELEIPAPATISVQGVFIDESTVRVIELPVHNDGIPDYVSYVGVMLVFQYG